MKAYAFVVLVGSSITLLQLLPLPLSTVRIVGANPLHNSSNFYYGINTTADSHDGRGVVNGDGGHHREEEQHVSFYYKPTKEYQAHVDNPSTLGRLTPEAYNSVREMLFRYEESKAFGSDVRLNKREIQANEIIMSAKITEYNEGLATPHLFKPSKHIFSVLEAISQSPLFKILTLMPKGGILHAHDTALCSTDFLIDLTYRPDLWMCESSTEAKGEALQFAKRRPTEKFETDCKWELLKDIREKRGNDAVDRYLREGLSMYPTEQFLDVNAAWERFNLIFRLLDGLLRYAPVWADYYYNALKEFYADGVQYLEFRSTLPTLYDMDGTVYTQMDTVHTYVETLQKFKKDNPGFIGSRMIYAPMRNVDTSTIEHYIKTCIEIRSKYPDFVAGFDLVGQEELGRPLKDFIPQLLSMPENIDFFFHAGETNWYGSSVDENLIDAVLLGTKRIGHGFGIIKHPLVLELVKERNIAIEVNPVSNQVLTLITDYRNHPCSHLFSNNYPVVISSDDPSFWRASPLSHDFYIAFLGIASAHADLRLLKKLAMNSIQYSSMNDIQKADALSKWEHKWNSYIERIISGTDNGAATGRFQLHGTD